jgi:hypothetical protein
VWLYDQLAALAALGIAWAGAVPAATGPLAQELPAGAVAATQPVPAKRLPQREHHDECDTVLYEGGTCTCSFIEQLGPCRSGRTTTWTTLDNF